MRELLKGHVEHTYVPAETDMLAATSEWRLRSVFGKTVTHAQLLTVPGPAITLVVGLVCTVLGLSVIWRGDTSETAAGFWPPAGAALVALLIVPIRRWGWAAIGIAFPTLIGLVLGVMPLEPGLWWWLGNTAEPVAAALVLRRFRSSRFNASSRLTAVFLLVGVALAPMIGGALGATGTAVGYDRSWSSAWLDWAIGDALGVLAVVPLLVTTTTRSTQRRTRGELDALVVLIMFATGLTFANTGPVGTELLPYLILGGLVWAGMRFGVRAAAAAGFVVGIGANIATMNGLGPFSAAQGSIDSITLQVFLAIALITSFVVASMTSELAGRDEVEWVLTQQATHDHLTGLPNRVLVDEWLARSLQARGSTDRGVGVFLVDLDNFKVINDRHGHPTGDTVLQAVADLLRGSLTADHFLARMEADEFVVLCDDLHGDGHAREIAATISHAVARPFDVGERRYRLTCSIGVAVAEPDDENTSTDLLRQADIALHQSKRLAGGDSTTVFDDALEATMQRRAALEDELREAIGRTELSVEFQPIIDLTSGRLFKFEALARWTNPRFGVVSPAEFITLAEETGQIGVIGDWVLETACRQSAAWQHDNDLIDPSAPIVAVNASARQLNDAGFPARVREILRDTGLSPAALIIEITETAITSDFDAALRVISELRAIGVGLSLDDFGTGYSSMTYLRRIPVNTLKIDQSFVGGLGVDAEDEVIVSSIITLAHSFGIRVVAEGIETMKQLEFLVDHGCDLGQGYLWSKSLRPHDAGALLAGASTSRWPAIGPGARPVAVNGPLTRETSDPAAPDHRYRSCGVAVRCSARVPPLGGEKTPVVSAARPNLR